MNGTNTCTAHAQYLPVDVTMSKRDEDGEDVRTIAQRDVGESTVHQIPNRTPSRVHHVLVRMLGDGNLPKSMSEVRVKETYN
jgi:hypothetical protein